MRRWGPPARKEDALISKIRGLSVATVAVCVLVLSACSSPNATDARPTERSGLQGKPPAATDLPGRVTFNTASGDIWVMDGDGSNRKKVTVSGPDTDFDPSWSPDGTKIVYRVNSDSDQVAPNGIGLDGIHVVNVRTHHVDAVEPPTGGLFPDWSPRGKKILFSGVKRANDNHDSIWVMQPDGSRLHAIATQQAECGEWSPDATRILYCSQPGNGDFETWVMDSDGTHRQQLTHSDGIDTGAIWSPDGSQIAFGSTRGGSSDLYVMNADGSHQRRVLAAPATGESPDAWLPGAGIVFSAFRNDAPLPRWFVVQPDGSHLRSLPQLQGASDPLDWRIFDGW